ncbi:MAG TPA: hypothetical protein VGJ28_10395 [Micromonosporaceae bacterium]|jgi:hypothetical protein
MVLYCAVHPLRPGLTRRVVLTGTGLGALALAGCSSPPVAKATAATLTKDPLGPLYTETLALITKYDQSIATAPALAPLAAPLREEHRQHATALAALMDIAAPRVSAAPNAAGRAMPPVTAPAPSAAPSSDPATAATRAQLAAAEATAQTNAVAACMRGPASRAAVLASIAACRASHVAALS